MRLEISFFFMFLLMLLLTWTAIVQPTVCVPIHGIDHNGKNEPFTIYLGTDGCSAD